MVAKSASCPACGTFLTVTHNSTVSMVCKHAPMPCSKYRNGTLHQVGTGDRCRSHRASVQVGEEGNYRGTGFQITGHVQLSNQGTGPRRDEFYLRFLGWTVRLAGPVAGAAHPCCFARRFRGDAPQPPRSSQQG